MLLRAFVRSYIPVKSWHPVISNMKLDLINKTTTFIFWSRKLAYPFMHMQKYGLQSGSVKMTTEESKWLEYWKILENYTSCVMFH